MPDYMKNLNAQFTWLKDSQGNPLTINENLPFQIWNQLGLKDLGSSVSPLIRGWGEIIAKKEWYNDKTIDPSHYQPAAKWLSMLGIDKIAKAIPGMRVTNGVLEWNDVAAWAFKQIPTMATMTRLTPAEESINTNYNLASTGLGVKLISFNETDARTNYNKGWSSKLQNLIGQTANENIPDADVLKKGLTDWYKDWAAQETNNDKFIKLKDFLDNNGDNIDADLKRALKATLTAHNKELAKYNEELKGKDIEMLKKLLSEKGILPENQKLYDFIKTGVYNSTQ
jgi:hypothetical protein